MFPGGIRTYNSGKRAAADLRLRPRDYRDRLSLSYLLIITVTTRTVTISQGDKSALFIDDSSLLDVTDKKSCLSLKVKPL